MVMVKVKARRHRLLRAITVFAAVSAMLFATTTFVKSAHAQDITSNLLGHWKFDETSGTTAADSSGNNYYGTLDNFSAPAESWRPNDGVIDGALWMNGPGADEHVDLNDWLTEFNMDSNYTLSVWVYLTDPGTVHHIIKAGVYSTANANQQYLMEVDNGILRFITGDRTVGDVDIFGSVAYNQWQHLVCVEDAGTKRCYVNGEQSGTDQTNDVTPPFGALARVMIGSRKDPSSQDLNGMVDDVRIYSRALTATDIKALYTRSNKFCSNPLSAPGVFYYNADRAALQYCDGDNWVMAGLGSYTPVAVEFDGTNDYLTRAGSITNTDSDKFTFSFWINPAVQGTEAWQAVMALGGASQSFIIGLDVGASTADNMRALYFYGSNASGDAVIEAETDDIIPAGQWTHILVSGDGGNNTLSVYVNGVQDTNFISVTPANGNIEFSRADLGIGDFYLGGSKFFGDLADFWFDTGTYIDLSDAAMRAKFLSPNNMPMYLGEDGSLATGAAPDIFLSGDVTNWHTNKGSGGGFTENGALTTGEKIPLTAAPDLTTGLIGHWKLDETSGTTASDSSGNGNSGTLTNFPATPTWQTGQFNGGLSFDGTDDIIFLDGQPIDSQTWDDFTISAWYKSADTTTADDQTIFMSGEATATADDSFAFVVSDDPGHVGELRLEMGAAGSAKANYYGDGTTLLDQQWHHVSVMRGGGRIKMYVDGILVSDDAEDATTLGVSLNTTGDGTMIGDDDADTEQLKGMLDDIRVYNRALSAGEVVALHAGTCSGPSGAGGTIIYNTDHKVMQYCNGVDWVAMSKIGGTGGGGCADPVGVAGEVFYDSDDEVMQYCNSEDWVIIGKPAPPASGLVAHYRLDETAGTNVENADNPGTHDGTFSGNANVVSASGKVATALIFDGTDDVVTVTAPAGLADLGPASWAFWVYRNSAADGTVMYKSDNNSDEGWWIEFESGYGGIGLTAVHSSLNLRRFNSAPGAGQWFHVAITWTGDADSTSANIYINGEITPIDGTDDSGSGTHASDATRDLFIGDGGTGASGNFDGRLDDIRIYNRVLSAEEVKQLYHATR